MAWPAFRDVRLVEGLALLSEEIESRLSYYNSAIYWIDIDQLLTVFNLTRFDLNNADKVNRAVRELHSRMPTYVTLKDVKKRWGRGQEDIFPVTQSVWQGLRPDSGATIWGRFWA